MSGLASGISNMWSCASLAAGAELLNQQQPGAMDTSDVKTETGLDGELADTCMYYGSRPFGFHVVTYLYLRMQILNFSGYTS